MEGRGRGWEGVGGGEEGGRDGEGVRGREWLTEVN